MRARGFTLLELLFVLIIVALLAGIVGPMLLGSISRARESTLKEDLFVMRKAIDDYYTDNGKYPGELAELVNKRYLRSIPADPVTERRDTWIVIRGSNDRERDGILDVRSGSELAANDGTPYRDW
ncbi:MAG: prepilin-type N-terminal cleavage/methylation domain-containing protein [Gallionellaceae bacterium]|jgi:general secretion pathway protein G